MAKARNRRDIEAVVCNVRKGVIDDSRVEGQVYDLDELKRRFGSSAEEKSQSDSSAAEQHERPPVP